MSFLSAFGTQALFYSSILILGSSIFLSFKTRFVQFRMIPRMFSLLWSLVFKKKDDTSGEATIGAHKALFTAMSTTIGISTIVSPVIAIKLGGPGALFGFLIATIFGAAVNFTEVTLALSYRKKLDSGAMAGGPMQYLKDAISPFIAKWYALFCCILMSVWSAAQANQLVSIVDSPSLVGLHIPHALTGACLAVLVVIILIGGVKRVLVFTLPKPS